MQCCTGENDLKIITYDDLLREAKERMDYISKLIIWYVKIYFELSFEEFNKQFQQLR